MKKQDYVSKIIDCCKKREDILINDEPMWKYNRYFDRMRKYARKLIDEDRQEELLPYLESDSISVRNDVAGLLFHCYPEKCTDILITIANQKDVPWCFAMVKLDAKDALKYGIPKDFP